MPATLLLEQPIVHYPESDGRPMAESDKHCDQMVDLRASLKGHFRAMMDVYVAGNLLLYYVEGDPRKSVAPDVFVVFGVPKRQRGIYKLWEEGKGPDVVIEVTSASTQKEDLGKKFRLYEQALRVPEYFLFDPTEDYLHPQLQGYRLRQGKYVTYESVEGRLHSETLNLDLAVRGEQLRLFDPQHGAWLMTPEEYVTALKDKNAEVERLRTELGRLRKE